MGSPSVAQTRPEPGAGESHDLVERAGFVDRTDRTALFDGAPYPSAPGFFLLSARAPRR